MRGFLMLTAVAVGLAFGSSAEVVRGDEPIRERIEWADIWVPHADQTELPRVLLIGDSITRGYFAAVEKELEGKAYCARLASSKCVTDPWFMDEVQLLLKQYSFDVIHFNNGLHGWGYSEEQYGRGLAEVIDAIQGQAVDTKLIWATTTPVRERGNLTRFAERTERVKDRNQIAAQIMQTRGVPTNDLFELVEGHPDWYSGDGTHFNGQGKAAQGKRVAETVSRYLPNADD